MTATKNGGAPGQEDTAAETLTRPPIVDIVDGKATCQPDATLAAARSLVEDLGWLVLACWPGTKVPMTSDGFYGATDDMRRVRSWLSQEPHANLGVRTGPLGPNVVDVDDRPDGSGWPAWNFLVRQEVVPQPLAVARTRSGGHIYFPGSSQPCGRLPKFFLDWKAEGGYVLVPPSVVDGRRYEWITPPSNDRPSGPLSWQTVRDALVPPRPASPRPASQGNGISGLVRWVADQQEGNRNAGLYWAACRAIEEGFRSDLQLLVEAAIQAGLTEHEAQRTVSSAERRLAGAA